MKNNKGFIELKNVSDYWKKLNFDYEILKENPENSYFGFNFFVTAYHLIDWIFEGKNPDERKVLNNTLILKIFSHIANGIKHFRTDRHKSIKEIYKFRVFDEGVFEEDALKSPITKNFTEEFKEKFGESILATDFADYVMEFWKDELKIRNLI